MAGLHASGKRRAGSQGETIGAFWIFRWPDPRSQARVASGITGKVFLSVPVLRQVRVSINGSPDFPFHGCHSQCFRCNHQYSQTGFSLISHSMGTTPSASFRFLFLFFVFFATSCGETHGKTSRCGRIPLPTLESRMGP